MNNYNCCNGNPECCLNRIEFEVDKLLSIKNRARRKQEFLDWILDMSEEIQYWRFKWKITNERK